MNRAPKPPLCPICNRPTETATKPFCSKRCAQIDLGRWLKGVYRVETDEAPEDGHGPGDVPSGG